MFFSKTFDAVFYASSYIDEIWVRSTIKDLSKRGNQKIGLLIGGEVPKNIAKIYLDLGVKVYSSANLKKYNSKVVVSSSTNLSKDMFSKDIKLIHMPHSLVSLHGVYPSDAFDAFDFLFACTPYHIREYKELTAIRNLCDKSFSEIGYGKFDVFLNDINPDNYFLDDRHVLIAPSWGDDNILETIGLDLIAELLRLDYRVTLRPHSMFYFSKKMVLESYKKIIHPLFKIEDFSSCFSSIFSSSILITDFSGISFEYYYLMPRKIIFVDTTPKIINNEFDRYKSPLVELDMRDRIGKIVPNSVSAILESILDNNMSCKGLGQDFIFNAGNCGKKAAAQLEELLC